MKDPQINLLRFSFLFFLILLAGEAAIAQASQEVVPEVKAVTVFLNRAQVFSTARTSVGAGQTEVIISNVPANIDVNSIQVEARGKVTLFGIRYENEYLQRQRKAKDLVKIEDSIAYFQQAITAINDQNDVYRKEETLMLANQSIGGQKGVIAEDLEDVADLFRNRLFSIRANIRKNDLRMVKLNEGLQRFYNQLNNYNNRNVQATGNIMVTLNSDGAAPVEFDLNYVVHNAGWKPLYDIRATNTKNPVKLFYKANVYQNTGVSWNNVKLTLTTDNPAVGVNKPELNPWYLDLPVIEKRKKKESPVIVTTQEASGLTEAEKNMGAAEAGDDSWGSEESAPEPAAASVADYTEISEGAIAVNFNLGIPASIPADGKMHLVEIQQFDVPALYTYSAVPKLAPEAFLMARITNWDDFKILPGEANIFLEGTFTGMTRLDPQTTGDTLTVSLGRDKRVVVTREKVKEFKSRSFLGNNRKETHGYLISVRNNREIPVEITMEDQIPVSNNSQVEVELEEGSGGNLEKATGKVTWQLKLKPNETEKIPLKFSIKYPKNQQVSGL
jgi:uncharacterized protein (TIGR02231 family)